MHRINRIQTRLHPQRIPSCPSRSSCRKPSSAFRQVGDTTSAWFGPTPRLSIDRTVRMLRAPSMNRSEWRIERRLQDAGAPGFMAREQARMEQVASHEPR